MIDLTFFMRDSTHFMLGSSPFMLAPTFQLHHIFARHPNALAHIKKRQRTFKTLKVLSLLKIKITYNPDINGEWYLVLDFTRFHILDDEAVRCI